MEVDARRDDSDPADAGMRPDETRPAGMRSIEVHGGSVRDADGGCAYALHRPHPALRCVHEIESELIELTGQLNVNTYRWLVLLDEFDDAGGWHGAGIVSLAHWLNWKCGIDLGAAREKVRVAKALPNLPRVSAAMARGALSYSKARAITRVATPETEEYLLGIAANGTAAHVERLVRAFRRVRDVEDLGRERAQQEARTVQWHVDADGSYVIHARLPAEAGALWVRALDAAVQAMPEPGVSAETYLLGRAMRGGAAGDDAPKVTWSARRADALAMMAETFLQHGFDPLAGGDRQQIVVHVDVETLAGAATRSGTHDHAGGSASAPHSATHDHAHDHAAAGRCELEDGPWLAAETARRLCCDAAIVRVVETAGEVLNVGRRTRSIPPAMRRALENRDRGCRFPGCTNARFVDGHHVRHWARGGETRLSNLVLLCRYHHRLVHEGGYDVQRLDDGAFRFVRPDGSAVPTCADVPLVDPARVVPALRDANEAAGIRIDATTAACGWAGEQMDYGMAVEGLMRLEAGAGSRRFSGNVGAGGQL